MPRLAIVIVTFESRGEIDGCLDSLTVSPPAVDHEIVVVDNASSDGTAARIRSRWPSVRVIEAGGNLGFARASNIGIRATASELVLLLNPDTRATAGSLDRLIGWLDTEPRVGIVGPRIVDEHGRAELSFGRMISPLAELRQKVLMVGNQRGLPFVRAAVDRMTRVSADVDWVSGACLLGRRVALAAAGLFDERFFLYTEDVDLCAAVRAHGWRVRFFAGAEIVHLRGRSAASDRPAAIAAYRRSQLAFYRKHHPAWARALWLYLRLRGQRPEA